MDYSAANTTLWDFMIQLGVIAGAILVSNVLRRRLFFVRKSLMPVAVLAGFLLLVLKLTGLYRPDQEVLETLVYHGIALGFIAMSLRVPEKKRADGDLTGLKSGAVIVSTYMVQGILGLAITLFLSYTFMPDLFKAAGLLLPMGYGQGPGQANNIGTSYEALGFAGGRSFGLAIAAAGDLVACVMGVVILNVLKKRGKISAAKEAAEEQHPVEFFQGQGELPVSDSIDRLSVQIAMTAVVYLAAYLVSWGITSGLSAIAPGAADTLNTLVWGFNFIIGSAIAMLVRTLLDKGREAGVIKHQYQNTYLLNRVSGFFFDIMIVAGIASINPEDIQGLWIPFLLLAVTGAAATWFHLHFVCKAVYKDYYYEGLLSMFGMMTGTISSGVLLLREIDPELATPASANLISGSSFGIVLGIPVLVLVGLAPKSEVLCWVTLGLAAVYLVFLYLLILKVHRRKPQP